MRYATTSDTLMPLLTYLGTDLELLKNPNEY